MKNRSAIMAIASLCLALIICMGSFIARAEEPKDFKINAKSAVLMDCDSGTVVYEQNAEQHLPIASMVKIMTLLITFEQVEAGNMSLSEEIVASENATSMGGSQAFLDTNNAYALSELIKSIVVGSANDSCVAIAEHCSGSVEGFVSDMNKKAQELGMEHTNFVNCTGLPTTGQYSCAKDVAIMTKALLKYKDFYNYSTVWMFDFRHPSGRVTQLSNTNKLIRAYEGCDGGKTGFTNEAMFCLSATAKRGTMRLISVVCGAETSKIRNGENAKLFNYGFSNYETKQLVYKNIELEENVPVVLAKQKTIKVAAKDDYFAFGKKGNAADYKIVNEINGLHAPIAQGDKVGEMKIYKGDTFISSVDLVATSSCEKITYLDIVDEFIERW